MKVLHRIIWIATVATLLAGQAGGTVIIQDETTNATWTIGNFFTNPPSPATDEPDPGDDQYQYSQGPGTYEYQWLPGLTSQYVVSASWGANPAHSTDVDYFFDSDGYGVGVGEVASAQNVNFTLMSDQITAASGAQWSGFYELGTYNLNPDSQFRIHSGSDYLTAAVWSFEVIPEPSALGLLVIGMATSGFFCRRRA